MVHGFVIVDKPEGVSSAYVVAQLKRSFKVKKAGHGGTLDPLASGVLPVALGEATKALSYILEGDKGYEFEIKWGEARSTDDREGEVTQTSSFRPGKEAIEAILPEFRGEIKQVPPPYSALKIKGKRAYELARAGEVVDLAPRLLKVTSLELLSTTPESACFRVFCSKGTYIRSLGRDMAHRLGTCGHLSKLRRIKAGPFHEKDAILLASLSKIGHNTEGMGYVLPLQDALADILALEIEEDGVLKLRQGQSITTSHQDDEVVLVVCRGIPQAFAQIEKGTLKPLRVFNLNESMRGDKDVDYTRAQAGSY